MSTWIVASVQLKTCYIVSSSRLLLDSTRRHRCLPGLKIHQNKSLPGLKIQPLCPDLVDGEVEHLRHTGLQRTQHDIGRWFLWKITVFILNFSHFWSLGNLCRISWRYVEGPWDSDFIELLVWFVFFIFTQTLTWLFIWIQHFKRYFFWYQMMGYSPPPKNNKWTPKNPYKTSDKESSLEKHQGCLPDPSFRS